MTGSDGDLLDDAATLAPGSKLRSLDAIHLASALSDPILDSFLANLSEAQQPAVWVSGFYDSGKSHLVRVLEHLWRDVVLPNGECAPDLVTLTDDICDHLPVRPAGCRRRQAIADGRSPRTDKRPSSPASGNTVVGALRWSAAAGERSEHRPSRGSRGVTTDR
jgi:hypothetical protein